jgi:FlaA1/EpsC-like NDP-sugar epimerase
MSLDKQTLGLIGRGAPLFDSDILHLKDELLFLVIGGAGSIGQAVTLEIFKRDPKVLHVVDISENNMVELVRSIRSTMGMVPVIFVLLRLIVEVLNTKHFFRNEGPYDYVLNLSALKHVRSEKDPYTLMRMIDVNIFNTIKTLN